MNVRSRFLIIILSLMLIAPFVSATMPEPTLINLGSWSSQLVTQEFDGNGDGKPDVFTEFTDLGDGLIQIDVTQTNYDGKGAKAYKWQSGLFADSGLTDIKVYYEDAQGGFTNSYGQDCVEYDYQWTTGWNKDGKSIGCALFGGGNSNKDISFQIKVPETVKNFTMFTGKNSEQITYVWNGEDWLLYDTDTYERDGFTIKVKCDGNYLDTYWLEDTDSPKFFWDETNAPYENCIMEVWDDSDILTFDQEKGIIQQEFQYQPFFNPSTGQTEQRIVNEPKFLNINDLINAPENNITTDNTTRITETKMGVLDCLERFEFWNWGDFNDCRRDPKLFEIDLHGTIYNTDPSLDLVDFSNPTGIPWQDNKTQANSWGESLESPVLFMNFNKENESTYVQDNSLNNNFGDLSGDTLWIENCGSPMGDGCYYFDGNQDYIARGAAWGEVLQPANNDWSLSIWFNTTTSNRGVLYSGKNSAGSDWLFLDINNAATGRVEFKADDGSDPLTTISSVADTYNDGEWHNVLITRDSSENNWTMYIDGIYQSSTTTGADSSVDCSSTHSIGITYDLSSHDFMGYLDNIQVWDRLITYEEVIGINNSQDSYIGKYANEGEFTSLVFYNSTNSTYWNVTQSIADSDYQDTLDYVNTSALVSYWRLDGDVTDSVGNNDGTSSGDVDTIGIVGHAREFNNAEYLTIANEQNFDFDEHSISFWVNGPAQGASYASTLFMKGDVSTNYGLIMDTGTAGTKIRNVVYTSSAGVAESTTTVFDNTWHHVVTMYNGTHNLIYVDGELDVTPVAMSGSVRKNNVELVIGKYNYAAGSSFYDGDLDEILIFNRSLSPTEISEIYNEQKNYYGVDMSEEYAVFDGVGDKIVIPDSDSLDIGTSDFSVNLWMKSPYEATINYILDKRATTGTYVGYALYTYGNKVVFQINDAGGYTVHEIPDAGTIIRDGEWHNIGWTADRDSSTGGKFYIDGVQYGSSKDISGRSGSLTNVKDLTINDYSAGGYTVRGLMDEILIFNKSLSASEIEDIYNSKFDLDNYSDANLISHWNMDGGFTDRVGDNDGTASGDTYTTDGLVSYWTFDGSFDDLVGGNDGTPANTTIGTGISSDAGYFDSSADEVDVDFTSGAGSYSALSVGTWIYWEGSVHQAIISEQGSDSLWFTIDQGGNDKLNLYLGDTSNKGYHHSDSSIVNNKWTYVVMTYDNDLSGGTFYINGQADGTFSTTGSVSLDSTMTIGDVEAGGKDFTGLIDEMVLYDKSLSASEVNELYKAGLSQHATTNITLQTRTGSDYNVSDAGLVGLWGLNGNANDELGVNNGTWNGGENYTDEAGVVGQGGEFDGVNDSVDITGFTSSGTTHTISMWSYHETNDLTNGYDNYFDSQTGRLLIYARDTSQDKIGFYDGTFRYFGNSLSLNEWHHTVFVFDGSTSKADLYVDGEHYGSQLTYTPRSIGGTTRIGSRYADLSGDWYSFDGSIDEVRIYNRSLSTDEIQNLYELGNYHINWNEWKDRGIKEDGVALTTNSSGKFMQFKDNFLTDDTSVSAYVVNYSISPGTAPVVPDTSEPYWTVLPSNISVLDNETIIESFTVTDDTAIDTCWLNDTSMITTNTTNYYNITNLTAGNYSYLMTCNDTSSNENSTVFTVQINESYIDTFPPQWLNNKTNLTSTILPDETAYYNITFTDDTGSGYYIFSYYNTTDWVNDSAVAWTNNTEVSVVKTNYALVGTINWTWYFNDSLGNSNQTDVWTQTLEAIPVITDIYPTDGTTITNLETITNFTVTFADGSDSCWYSIDGGVTNVSQDCSGGSGSYEFTGINFVEGSNTITIWANNSLGGVGEGSSTFTIDLPPVCTNGESGEQNLIFSHTQSCSDTIGVDSEWYSWKGVNYTYTGAVDLQGSAGVYTLTAYCNDTYGSVAFDSDSVTLRDKDTNATTECPDGYYLDGDGTCKVDQTGSGGTSTIINTCRYKKLGYYNTKLAWAKQINCI